MNETDLRHLSQISCGQASEELKRSKNLILEKWAHRAKRVVPAARQQAMPQLQNHLPDFLDRLAEALAEGVMKQRNFDPIWEEHGQQRANLLGYSLPQMLREYGILREVILEVLESVLSNTERTIILDSIEEGMVAATESFVKVTHDDDTEGQARENAYQEALAKLTEERHKFEAIFEQAPAAMALWRDSDMVFEMVNPGYQALFPGRKLLGRPFLEALPEFKGQPFYDFFRKVFETGEPFVGREVLAQHRATEEGPIEDHYYDFTYLRIADAEGKPYGVYDHAVDVTERVLGRQAVEKSRKQLEASVSELEKERELRERFVSALTHDLRTPLSAAKMSAQLIQRSANDPEAVHRLAARIVTNIGRCDQMIQDLLDASRIGANQTLPLKVGPCNLKTLAASTLEDLASYHGQRFVLKAEGDFTGDWDCAYMRRVIENLAVNAVKYGSRQDPITVTLQQTDAEARLEVHNCGEPITDEDQKKLFGAFHRTQLAKTSGYLGWGIGLMLVKGVAEAHGGRVNVKSSAVEGTTFTVVLPKSRAN